MSKSFGFDMLNVVQSVERWLPLTETWLYNQLRFLPKDICNHVVCETTENLGLFPCENLHALTKAAPWRYYLDKGARWIGLRRHLTFLVEQAAKHHASLLHSHFGHVGWANLAAARGIRHLTTFYGLDVNFLPMKDSRWFKRYRALFASADRILCEGPHMAHCIMALGCPEAKIKVHHLGVAVEEIPFKPRSWNVGEPLRVLLAASFREKKGLPYALEALGVLQREVPLEITLIGDAGNEARSQVEKARILAAIDKYKLGKRVRLCGFQPHQFFFQEAYRHHLFLSPSVSAKDGDTEGGAPVSLIEMLASGMPVVATRHCDIPEVVRHMESGLLADERDISGLVEQLRWWVDNPGRWQPMLECGRQHVEKEFNARSQGEKLASVYRELVG
ncbi:MAG: glycosyltransferase [Chlorobium sp.]|nr:glycosyltransferase [Chlorobium sp.]